MSGTSFLYYVHFKKMYPKIDGCFLFISIKQILALKDQMGLFYYCNVVDK